MQQYLRAFLQQNICLRDAVSAALCGALIG
jgi:hypothetical protein